MPGSNLTRDEATARAGLLQVAAYDVALDLTDGGGKPGERTFRSLTTVQFSCAQPGSDTFIDLVADSVRSATLNGEPVDVTGYDPEQGIVLRGLQADNELVVDADCRYMNSGEGLHRFVDPVDGEVYLYSQFETTDAHRVYACFDQPDLKAPFTFHVTVPQHWEVMSNAGVESTDDSAAGGAKTAHLAPTAKMSPYITAIVAGAYHAVRAEHDGIPLGVYCRQSLARYLDADDILEVTKQGLDCFQEAFGFPYMFGKYDQVFVPEFNAGAMENAGCVTFVEDYIFRGKVTRFAYESRANTILHEMAHMWFGDLVTMRWWDDLWLNESFAEWAAHYAAVEATRYTEAWTTFCTGRKAWGYRQDQLSSTHPIACDIPDVQAVEVNFDGITYAKGASVLKQLVAYVGQTEFLTGLRAYFARHAYGNTRLADLLAPLEGASGRDLSSWSADWLETAGVNTLRPAFEVSGEGDFTSFAVLQEAPDVHPALRSHRLAIGLYDLVDGSLVRRRRVETDVVGAKTEVAELIGERQPDVVLLNDDDLTYAKIRLDERSLATVTSHIGDFTDSLPRALCWAAAWDMTRDAELPTRDYLRLILSGIGGESAIGVVQVLLRQVSLALSLYADPAWSQEGLAMLAAAAYDNLRAAEPGSDHQLTWARAFAGAARGPEHLAIVRGLLDGSTSVEGLAVDTELRWHLLQCLVATGAAGDDDIEAELQRDPTDAGQREAWTARALRPTAEAKEQAWRMATEDDDLPNQTGLAVIRGFSHRDQTALLERYVARYFEVVGEVWARRSSEVAQNVAVGLYPSWAVSADTVRATEAYLADTDVPPALRRLISEGRDGVLRALRARERDAATT
ncbi:MAG: aminopeptidase N [Actinomycetota bacterium]|nr:aminopeptidase N [Actinomycetota bacterium]